MSESQEFGFGEEPFCPAPTLRVEDVATTKRLLNAAVADIEECGSKQNSLDLLRYVARFLERGIRQQLIDRDEVVEALSDAVSRWGIGAETVASMLKNSIYCSSHDDPYLMIEDIYG